MLVVEDKAAADNETSGRGTFNPDEFIWNHGITPPLKHVRKRRFRKRASRRVRVLTYSCIRALLAHEVANLIIPVWIDNRDSRAGSRTAAGSRCTS